MEFQFPEALCKLIAAGYKNVRANKPLLLELGQQSILTGDVCNFLVECHDVQAPEQLTLPGVLEICEQLGEDRHSLVTELIVQVEHC